MNMIKRKYILSCLLFCTLITDVYASGFEAPASQAAQAIGAAVIASVATAVAIATEIIRPVDPEKDLPEPKIQEKPKETPPQPTQQKTIPSQIQSSPVTSHTHVKPQDFQTPIWQTAQQKNISQKAVQIQILIRPTEGIPQPEIPESQTPSSSISTTQATLITAQKLHQQKQILQALEQNTPSQTIQQSTPAQQKQILQKPLQQTPVSFEFNESEEFDNAEEEPIFSFTQLYAQKRSINAHYTDKLLYERSVHFYFDRIQNSSLLKIDPVYQQLIISRRSAANFSVADKENLLLRHESLIHGLHEAHQEIMLLQEQDSQSSDQTPDNQHNKNTQPPLDPKDPKDKKNTLLELAEKITASIFDLLKKKYPQFFRDGYGLWNKAKVASISPAMQKVAEFLNIEKDELDIHIRHIFEPAIKVIQNATLRINGFHHDYNNLLEKSGMFKFVNKEMFAQGYYKAIVEIASKYSAQPVLKSFFPAHWSQEQVMQEIHYAIRNMELVVEGEQKAFGIIYNIPEYLHAAKNASKMLTFIGHTTNNIPIWIVLNPYLKAFITFYPILGK